MAKGAVARSLKDFDANNARIAAFCSGGGPLAKLAGKFADMEKLTGIARVIHARVVARLVPAIRAELAARYSQSGLKQESGDLYRAAVTEALVEATDKGIHVGLGRGFDKQVYISAGALDAGWVTGSATKGAKKRKAEKKTLQYIAGKTGQTQVGGAKFHRGRDFFDLSDVAGIEELYREYFQQEVDKVVGAKK